MTQQLSSAAQAIRDAVLATYADNIPKDDSLWALERASTVAALRAAADLVAPETYECFTGDIVWDSAMEARSDDIREALFSIAAELEGQ
jgi:hypothetical protein